MKKTFLLAMTGVAILLFTNSQAFAASELGFADDMGEGISFMETQDSAVSYTYDNSLPDAEEIMAEGIYFSEEVQDDTRYLGDNSIPSMEHLMTDGICMDTLLDSIVTR